MNAKKKAYIYSVVGLILVGLGLSLLGEAIIYKMEHNIFWIPMGTLALSVTNAGICFVGNAVLLKAKL